jgi:hypothetical protein
MVQMLASVNEIKNKKKKKTHGQAQRAHPHATTSLTGSAPHSPDLHRHSPNSTEKGGRAQESGSTLVEEIRFVLRRIRAAPT